MRVQRLPGCHGDVEISALVRGFGCRLVVTYPPVLRAGVRKPPRKEPAGAVRKACSLWGLEGAAAWVRMRMAGVIGGGSTIAAANLRRGGRRGDFGLATHRRGTFDACGSGLAQLRQIRNRFRAGRKGLALAPGVMDLHLLRRLADPGQDRLALVDTGCDHGRHRSIAGTCSPICPRSIGSRSTRCAPEWTRL
jgi:hypothetical protein